jgi:dTDP-4-dehydrorhamnose 3,5-epimerase
MKKELSLQGPRLIEIKIYPDSRGFFTERFNESRFNDQGLPSKFVQDNHSRSKPGVIRGLHYQHAPGQGKLVGVIRGRIWDVIVDLRRESPTYGKWDSVELNDQNGLLLWIPEGFAHGFCVLGHEDADVIYKVDSPYSPKTEGGIRYDDPALKIEWPVQAPIVSDKDRVLPGFSDYSKWPVF